MTQKQVNIITGIFLGIILVFTVVTMVLIAAK